MYYRVRIYSLALADRKSGSSSLRRAGDSIWLQPAVVCDRMYPLSLAPPVRADLQHPPVAGGGPAMWGLRRAVEEDMVRKLSFKNHCTFSLCHCDHLMPLSTSYHLSFLLSQEAGIKPPDKFLDHHYYDEAILHQVAVAAAKVLGELMAIVAWG